MPSMKKFSGTPPPPAKNSGRVGAAKGFKSKAKKDPAARRRPIDADIYGEELFQSNFKKEKEIVICFYPFTKNNYRISTEGKFIIERVEVGELIPDNFEPEEGHFPGLNWNLFYYPIPLADLNAPSDLDEFKNIEYEIKQDQCESFLNYTSLKDLENKVIELVRMEFFAEKQAKLETLREADKKFQEDLDKVEKEEEEKNEQEIRGHDENISSNTEFSEENSSS